MTYTRILSYFLWIWLAIFTVPFSGCMHVFQKTDAPLPTGESSAARIAFEDALADYGNGNFEGALARFRVLAATGGPDAISRKAKMGEIYCRMMLAKTQADYRVAIDMWKKFGRTTKKDGESWAVTLADPLVDRLQPYGTENKLETAPSPATLSPEGEQRLGTKQPDQYSNGKSAELTKNTNQVDQLQRKMDKVIKENQSLKEKIKALEAIDQNIQRKKSEIAITDEQANDKE